MPVGNAYRQSTYRFRSDDGSETAASWLAAENTDTTIALDTNFRIRIAVSSSGVSTWSNLVWNLYYSLNEGSYTAVTASSPVKFSASSNFADGADTTNQLTKEYLTFITDNNAMKETTGGATNSGNAGTADGFETEWCLTLDSAQVDADDTIDFRIYRGTTALNAYDYTPRATVTAASASGAFIPINMSAQMQSLNGNMRG